MGRFASRHYGLRTRSNEAPPPLGRRPPHPHEPEQRIEACNRTDPEAPYPDEPTGRTRQGHQRRFEGGEPRVGIRLIHRPARLREGSRRGHGDGRRRTTDETARSAQPRPDRVRPNRLWRLGRRSGRFPRCSARATTLRAGHVARLAL